MAVTPELIVTHSFGRHKRGHRISDPAQVQAILAGESRGYVVPVARIAKPEPVAAPAVAKP